MNKSKKEHKSRKRKSIDGKQPQHRKQTKSSDDQEPSTSRQGTATSDTEHSTETAIESGFYYDKEKKRYFKILPCHGNIRSAITKETVAAKEAETKRKHDLDILVLNQGSKETRTTNYVCNKSIIPVLTKYALGDINRDFLEPMLIRRTIPNLKSISSVKVFETPSGRLDRLEHMLQMEVSADRKGVLGLWSLKGTMMQRIQYIQIKDTLKAGENTSPRLCIDPAGTVVLQSLNKITNVCWAPVTSEMNKKFILYTTMSYTGDSLSLALIRNIDPGSFTMNGHRDFSLGKKATWTCAWNSRSEQFSVGTEKCALVVDVKTRKMWEYSTGHSDVLAQAFCTESGNLLMSGTRKGLIVAHDLRTFSKYWAFSLKHPVSICSLKLTSCQNHLLASDLSGKVRLWDLRMRRWVVDYRGLFNEYSKIPIHLDDTETIVYGVGQDCYTKFWCMKTGRQLLSLPAPCETSRETIPAVQYSSMWSQGKSGLLMGIKDELHLYSSSV